MISIPVRLETMIYLLQTNDESPNTDNISGHQEVGKPNADMTASEATIWQHFNVKKFV